MGGSRQENACPGFAQDPAGPSGVDPSGRNDGAVLPVRILAASPSPERGTACPTGDHLPGTASVLS
jgi:hypothetical protein